jgi:hypothetical protein
MALFGLQTVMPRAESPNVHSYELSDHVMSENIYPVASSLLHIIHYTFILLQNQVTLARRIRQPKYTHRPNLRSLPHSHSGKQQHFLSDLPIDSISLMIVGRA